MVDKIEVLLEAIRTAKTPEEKRETVLFVKTIDPKEMTLENFKRIGEAFKRYHSEDFEHIQPFFDAVTQMMKALEDMKETKQTPKK